MVLVHLGAQALKPDLDDLGAESVDDLKELDDKLIEQLKAAADKKMKPLKAKKFIKAIAELGAGSSGASSQTLPLSQRTFGTSNFKAQYARTNLPDGPLELGAALQDLLREYCHAEGLDWHSVGQPFLKKLQTEAMKNSDELADSDMIPVAAQRMWTSALQLGVREFCSILNAVVRTDRLPAVEHAAVVIPIDPALVPVICP